MLRACCHYARPMHIESPCQYMYASHGTRFCMNAYSQSLLLRPEVSDGSLINNDKKNLSLERGRLRCAVKQQRLTQKKKVYSQILNQVKLHESPQPWRMSKITHFQSYNSRLTLKQALYCMFQFVSGKGEAKTHREMVHAIYALRNVSYTLHDCNIDCNISILYRHYLRANHPCPDTYTLNLCMLLTHTLPEYCEQSSVYSMDI